ncbi:hypothetical protein [Pseudoxanthomonas indica]|uniref:Transmembrane protein n=1 Tax=Pseudoxanthomonas indica TaxID=428993 RepID=A0A1T5LJ15_9GAMM|nr:hypothetical protein [Pseudoxanthomonas indica]GGD35452.1 hypothetical protein GCM10007235_04310 [Pseudoxanthomonas indica]SKC75629.1 hypothetical protein SAMN06296058_2557 [Pseudoxanthomonas indica]
MIKKIVGVLALMGLLAPSVLMAMVWTPINLVAAIAIVVSWLALSKRAPGVSRLGAAIAALLLTFPLYPHWIWNSNDRGWHFHVGTQISNLGEDWLGFAGMFVYCLMLFAVVRWAFKATRTHLNQDALPAPGPGQI